MNGNFRIMASMLALLAAFTAACAPVDTSNSANSANSAFARMDGYDCKEINTRKEFDDCWGPIGD